SRWLGSAPRPPRSEPPLHDPWPRPADGAAELFPAPVRTALTPKPSILAARLPFGDAGQYSTGSSGVSRTWSRPALRSPRASRKTTPDSSNSATRLGSAIAAFDISPKRHTSSEGWEAAMKMITHQI